MSNPRQIREETTKKIIAALEKDLLPWRKPWASNNAGQHSNAHTKKSYRGVNPLLLQIHAALFGFASTWWATFNQWKAMGYSVNRRPDHVEAGQWGATLAVYIPVTKKAEEPVDDDEDEAETFWILKKFTVFNADQVSGADAEKFQFVETAGDVHPDYEPAEELIQATGQRFTSAVTVPSIARLWELGPITTTGITSKSRTNRHSSTAATTRQFAMSLLIGAKYGSAGIVRKRPMRWGN